MHNISYAVTLLLILLCTTGNAQTPGLFNYQAVFRKADGTGIINQSVDIRFQIFNAPTLGQQVFEEEFSNVNTGDFGVINLQIGYNGNVDLRELNWNSEPHFVNIQIRQNAGAYTDISTNRTQLVSVPFALNAHKSDSADFALHTYKADTADFAFTSGTQGGNSDGNLISASVSGDTLLLVTTDGVGNQTTYKIKLSSTGDQWGNQVALHDRTLKGKGIASDSLGLANMGAVQGQVLKWISNRWEPSTDLSSGTVVSDNLSIEGDGTIGNVIRIKNGGVTNAKIASNTVTTDKIANGEIGSEDLSDMDADDGDVLTYGVNGWNPQPPEASGTSPWTKEGDNVFVNNGEKVGIGTSTPSTNLTVIGEIGLETDFGTTMVINSNNYGPSGNMVLYNHPQFGDPYVSIVLDGGSGGSFDVGPGINLAGPDGQCSIGSVNLGLYSGEALVESAFHLAEGGSGYVSVVGSDGSENCRLTNLLGYPNHGFVAVKDPFNVTQAGILVNEFGEGQIFADVKNFRMDHPRDPGKEIWYASLEGPEAGAYERGTDSLKDGEVFIPYSEHFQLVINPSTTTVTLTPLYTDTYGLAVIEKNELGFKVKELKNGTGNFKFDYYITGVRKGYEDYKAVREKDSVTPE